MKVGWECGKMVGEMGLMGIGVGLMDDEVNDIGEYEHEIGGMCNGC